MSHTAETASEPFMCGNGQKPCLEVRFWVIFALPTMTDLWAHSRSARLGQVADRRFSHTGD